MLKSKRTTTKSVKSAVSSDVEPLKSVRNRSYGFAQKAMSARSGWSDPFSPFTGRYVFEASNDSPRLARVPDTGPNSHNGEIEKVRARSRWMYLNDPMYRQACRQVGNNVVHYGIKPNVKDRVLRKIWNKFVRESDARKMSDFYGQQYFSAITVARDGEVFPRLIPCDPATTKSGIGFKIKVLEADHVPISETRSLGENFVMSGIETDMNESVVAYWMLDYHPKDYIIRGNSDATPKRVDAEHVLHIYMQERFSGCRGYPWGASALNVTERYRTYDDVELERKIMASSKGGYFKKPRYAGDEEEMFEGDDEDMFRPMSPGEYVQVPEGWDIQETTPAASDTNYEVYKREQISGLAVAFGFAVELVSMNWRYLASDRQYRALMLEVVRLIESIQYHMMVHQFCKPVWERFVSEAYANGLWTPDADKDLEDYFDVEWITPKRGYIHPVQDVTAVTKAISAGLDSRKRAVGAIGEDVEDIDAENAEDMSRSKRMGLPYAVLGLDGQTQAGAQVSAQSTDMADLLSKVNELYDAMSTS